MNADIRIAVTFKNHRKRLKLRRILGPGSTDYLLDLWITVAMERPDGNLDGLDETDIALMAGWHDEPNAFTGALVDAGFLEVSDVGWSLHDWEQHQRYAVHAKEREEQARHAAHERWNKKRGKKRPASVENTNGMLTACSQHADSNAPIPFPSPIPSPIPKDIKDYRHTIPPEMDDVKRYCQERGSPVDPVKFYDFYASKGWMVGQNKMKDWQAALRTWERDSRNGDGTAISDNRPKKKWELAMEGKI